MSNTPIFGFKVSGNCKEKLSNWQYSFICSFEQHLNQTFCAVKTGFLNRSQIRQELKNLEKSLKRKGIVPVELKYYKDGITLFHNNLI